MGQAKYAMTANSIVVIHKGTTLTITNTHINYNEIRKLILENKVAEAFELMDLASMVSKIGHDITVKGGAVYHNGVILENAACDALLNLIEEAKALGLDPSKANIKPLTNFLARLMSNPDPVAVDGLWRFIEAAKMTLMDDGRFVAYKCVARKVAPDGSEEFFDHYTQKYNNSVGSKVQMPRNECDSNPNATCSSGLHVCSESYLSQYSGYGSEGGTVVLVAVDPADVVAVPTDYNNAKMRVCAYEVIGVREVDRKDLYSSINEFNSTVYRTSYNPFCDEDVDYKDDEYEDDEYEDDDEESDTTSCDELPYERTEHVRYDDEDDCDEDELITIQLSASDDDEDYCESDCSVCNPSSQEQDFDEVEAYEEIITSKEEAQRIGKYFRIHERFPDLAYVIIKKSDYVSRVKKDLN